MPRNEEVTLQPLDLRVLVALRDDPRRWLDTDRLAAAVGDQRAGARERTAILAALSWMVRRGLVTRYRPTPLERAQYAITTAGVAELARLAQTALDVVA